MFERGKKDTGAFDTESGQSLSDRKPAPNTQAPKTSGHTNVSVIGRSIRIDGDLRGEEDLRIEGDVNGTIQLRNNTLTIGSEGKISANVYAKSVTVDGMVQGDLFGSESVSIRNNAQVNGNITAPRVSLEDGAKFKGSIEMDRTIVEKSLGLQSGTTSGPKAVDAPAKTPSRSNNELHLSKSGKAGVKSDAKNKSLV